MADYYAPTVTIMGSVYGPSGSPVTSGTVKVRLSSPGRVEATGTLVTTAVVNGQVTWTLIAGTVPVGTTLVPNASITSLDGTLGESRYFALYECVIDDKTEKWEEVWYVPATPSLQEIGDLAANAAAL